MAVNHGLIGFGLFLWFLWIIWKETFLLYKFTQDRFFKAIAFAFLGIILGLIIECLASESIFGCFDNGGYQLLSSRLYFWVLLGIVMWIRNFEKKVMREKTLNQSGEKY